jgi:hypothetical protein
MARRNTKLCEMSQRIHCSLTANRSINTTDTQMNAVRNSNNRMIVRGNITAWSPPISSSRTNEHAKELLNPTSVSSWYWNHRYNENEEVTKELRINYMLKIAAQTWVQLCYLYISEEHTFLPNEIISINTSLINTLLFISDRLHVLALKMKDISGLCVWDGIVGRAPRYGLDSPGIESWWGRNFLRPPDRPWGPPSLLFSGYQVFSRG